MRGADEDGVRDGRGARGRVEKKTTRPQVRGTRGGARHCDGKGPHPLSSPTRALGSRVCVACPAVLHTQLRVPSVPVLCAHPASLDTHPRCPNPGSCVVLLACPPRAMCPYALCPNPGSCVLLPACPPSRLLRPRKPKPAFLCPIAKPGFLCPIAQPGFLCPIACMPKPGFVCRIARMLAFVRAMRPLCGILT